MFLLEKLERMGGGAAAVGGPGGDKAQFKTQRVMLCTWLTEIFLKRIASLGKRRGGAAVPCCRASWQQRG